MQSCADDAFSMPPRAELWRAPPAGRVLVLAPHPDDEVLGPGGALLLHRRQGDPVRVVLATDGIAGDPDRRFERATYAARRRAETRAGLARLEVSDVQFWGLPDSCEITDADIDMLAHRAAAEIAAFAPDVLYVPWEGEGHADHRAVHCGTIRALRTLEFGGWVLGYEVGNTMAPDAILDITGVIDHKRAAVELYPSQLCYVDYVRAMLGLHAHRALSFERGVGYGEGYRIVRLPPR